MGAIRGQGAKPRRSLAGIAAAIAFCGVASSLIASPWLLPQRLEKAVYQAVNAAAHVWLEVVWQMDWDQVQPVQAEPSDDDSPQPAIRFLSKRGKRVWRSTKSVPSAGESRARKDPAGPDRQQSQPYLP